MRKNKRLYFWGVILGTLLVMAFGLVISASAVSGAAFTTFNPWVDGDFKDVCKNSQINCNIYGSKPDVWLNGGPSANGLGPDGEYFFAVLVPGGQPDPNDDGVKNLSDDFDAYTNRTFTVTGGEVSFYGGSHDQDSGNFDDPNRATCSSPRGCDPDGNPPLIRLAPYADTTNPGGVYILAICSLEDGYPVEPRDCKYDAFKVKDGPVTYEIHLKGLKFKDFNGNGVRDPEDPGSMGWEMVITGTGFDGEPIDAIAVTEAGGYWDFWMSYTLHKNDTIVPAEITVCENLRDPQFIQTFPADGACYELTIDPAAMAYVDGLIFGNGLNPDPNK